MKRLQIYGIRSLFQKSQHSRVENESSEGGRLVLTAEHTLPRYSLFLNAGCHTYENEKKACTYFEKFLTAFSLKC